MTELTMREPTEPDRRHFMDHKGSFMAEEYLEALRKYRDQMRLWILSQIRMTEEDRD